MSKEAQLRRIRVRALIEAALPHLDALPTSHRADVYEGIAEVTRGLDPKTHRTALRIAGHLRNSDLLQLHFRNLFAESDSES